MLQLCKRSNTGSKPTCLVLWTIFKHDPTSHLATARASDSVIYSDIARVVSLRIIIIIIIIIILIFFFFFYALVISSQGLRKLLLLLFIYLFKNRQRTGIGH